jgi:hypothetical protein
MGQARQRGTREQRIALAKPRTPKLSAEERNRQQAAELARGLQLATSMVLAPLLGVTRRDPLH